jgi:hypothetical protein
MSTLRLYALFILLLVFPLLLQGEGFQVKVIADEGDLPEKFCSLWKKDPQALIQVNHPRSGDIGYFNNYDLDSETASSARKILTGPMSSIVEERVITWTFPPSFTR